ncbi:hypothetical protein BO94DRAFT_72778 [Aspergillus sclerotioniger CBS 115572]|uniref:Uncharacterized protein n=1 Tax=Aspergillus sclerotioniger CBS 115572 TaxID=1450535 RepID=A0A317WQ42_9EURO|nr:hypothetical protein BO94DRAFT_72778 [Aspergillus sclerotioniger CBS 115572]PWY87247.1 hypothetical protein BO94DRAFT_72778 [Aspergillus sclerotioniger CBS 115572]
MAQGTPSSERFSLDVPHPMIDSRHTRYCPVTKRNAEPPVQLDGRSPADQPRPFSYFRRMVGRGRGTGRVNPHRQERKYGCKMASLHGQDTLLSCSRNLIQRYAQHKSGGDGRISDSQKQHEFPSRGWTGWLGHGGENPSDPPLPSQIRRNSNTGTKVAGLGGAEWERSRRPIQDDED